MACGDRAGWNRQGGERDPSKSATVGGEPRTGREFAASARVAPTAFGAHALNNLGWGPEAKFEAIDRRFEAMEKHFEKRFDDMRDLWRAELHRVEEVLDARLKHLEQSR